jgi:hypothetical protein
MIWPGAVYHVNPPVAWNPPSVREDPFAGEERVIRTNSVREKAAV